mmetsp:Transcript_10577/g.33019  ORF Transcript_10577/g.33019 Transcript_10577/m.33019 type:complete len:214 (-) Transcript_10577:1327-1968(-)
MASFISPVLRCASCIAPSTLRTSCRAFIQRALARCEAARLLWLAGTSAATSAACPGPSAAEEAAPEPATNAMASSSSSETLSSSSSTSSTDLERKGLAPGPCTCACRSLAAKRPSRPSPEAAGSLPMLLASSVMTPSTWLSVRYLNCRRPKKSLSSCAATSWSLGRSCATMPMLQLWKNQCSLHCITWRCIISSMWRRPTPNRRSWCLASFRL